MEDGSWTTSSLLEFAAEQEGDIVVECYARHQVLGENSRAVAHLIQIGK